VSYIDLDIYKKAFELAVEVHEMTLALPKFEQYEEGGQVRRSAKAIVGAIVEGYGRRRYKPEYIRYLVFATAECDETKEHLKLLVRTKSLTDADLGNRLTAEYEILSKMINQYILWVEKNWNV
jgi:four helix bundle protein